MAHARERESDLSGAKCEPQVTAPRQYGKIAFIALLQ